MKVLELRLTNGEKPTKAFADLELENGLIIKDVKVIQQPGQRAWVALPQMSWKDPSDGQIKYRVLVTAPPPLKGEIDVCVLSAWSREKQEQQNAKSNFQR